MTASDIRSRFLSFFEERGHAVRPSSSLVPRDDPTLLFVNSGMVQFKDAFLGEETLPFDRAATSQKCLRVSGKHNDLEEVGVTARHHTFFEMLGNFSFGDYFKRQAIDYAWELMTREFGLPADRLWASVHHTDDDAAALWTDVAGLDPSRVYRLGDEHNFWQMADTGPCGPNSELHYDLRPDSERGTVLSTEAFVEAGDRGEFLELWNLVFMQYDRQPDGELVPLPAPSVDTGAGLERLAAILQGVPSNYETDLFTPLIDAARAVVGVDYVYDSPEGVSYRVLADHARAVAFLLADGVFPSNEGPGYVLRRVLRRAVRHAWMLGRREPTLTHVVDAVTVTMGDAYPELRDRRDHLLRHTRKEEERFLETIDAGMERFEAIAPRLRTTDASAEAPAAAISGEDAFLLYGTFGFPLDLTELMAEERGYTVDREAFEAALEEERERSRADRRASADEGGGEAGELDWTELSDAPQSFVGYAQREIDTVILAFAEHGDRVALVLRDNPFYAQGGGQISDAGRVEGGGWAVSVDDVHREGDRVVVAGPVEGAFDAADPAVRARVASERHDTERNHTATHLLHAALRTTLGEHVVQRGSLVAPDRLRFDFAHTGPLDPDERAAVEAWVNARILEDHPVTPVERGYREAVDAGAMALFGEKYGDTVRVVEIPEVSAELCGGTHVRRTSEIGQFRLVSESSVGAGVRRVEAVTGPAAYALALEQEATLRAAAEKLRTSPDRLVERAEQVAEELRSLERELREARAEGAGDAVGSLVEGAEAVDGARVVSKEVDVGSVDELRALGDSLRDRLGTGAAVLAARMPERTSLFAVVTDDLVGRGVRADVLVREVATRTGGSGGGRPHMAQGGVGDPDQVADALRAVPALVRDLLGVTG
ncbi:MAG TPA: alanine--tRNA ligase [Longimicrobiales bacterium]|nr:alanine--tRNA ligase [Longimicrobiales bacterium]